ncbi:tektin-4 isoform X1 [Homo sapiens]|uniref:tektin-4 isoform X1 n=1 Tax=Homo sapiens TaxID=9606 RepID=UPI0023DEF3A1|nr:tektin-4 isoform X1 [Homo sapiens]
MAQTVPPCELPCKEYDVARNTGAYTSSGLATASFRTSKYLLEEWFQNCYARYHQAFADRDQSERQRHESQQLATETQALAQRMQQDSTRTVGERLQDTHGWKSELQREMEALAAETNLLLAQKQRLERALDATEVPFSITTDNLQCRERREHPNLVRDHVETELLKEAELIRNIQELLKRTIMQAVSQIRLNREHKETCEMDWSDKMEAYNIDETCGRHHSQSTEVQAHPYSTTFQESASTPETRAKFTQDNLCRAQRERLASANLRVLVDCILRDTSEDLRLQCDAVNLAFGRRCEELEDARYKLHHHLHKGHWSGLPSGHSPKTWVGPAWSRRSIYPGMGAQAQGELSCLQTLREITDQEHNVAALKQAIKDKEAPLHVAQTRLYLRSHRPNMELCRDAAQFRLLSEVEELNMSLTALREKLLEAEQSLRNLEDIHMSLEKDIAAMTNSLFIDRQKCMAHRTRYPTILQLAGYQ